MRDVALVQAGGTVEEIAVAEGAVSQAEAALQAARAVLDQATLHAPFAGAVTALEVSQILNLITRHLQKRFHFLIQVCTMSRGACLFPSQQLGNIGLRNLDGGCQVSLLKTQLIKLVPDYQRYIQQNPPFV